MAEFSEIEIVHGSLLEAYCADLTLKDVLSCLAEMPEIKTADDFSAAVSALIILRRRDRG